MIEKYTPPELTRSLPEVSVVVRFLRLKALYRQGWLRNGIGESQCESVADHSFSTALLAWIMARETRPDLDANRVLQLALLHEAGEVLVGDITPTDGISADRKTALESDAVAVLFAGLPTGGYRELWQEFEAGETPEAGFVKQIDKVEMALQAWCYRHIAGMNPADFLASTLEAVSDPGLRAIVESLASQEDR